MPDKFPYFLAHQDRQEYLYTSLLLNLIEDTPVNDRYLPRPFTKMFCQRLDRVGMDLLLLILAE